MLNFSWKINILAINALLNYPESDFQEQRECWERGVYGEELGGRFARGWGGAVRDAWERSDSLTSFTEDERSREPGNWFHRPTWGTEKGSNHRLGWLLFKTQTTERTLDNLESQVRISKFTHQSIGISFITYGWAHPKHLWQMGLGGAELQILLVKSGLWSRGVRGEWEGSGQGKWWPPGGLKILWPAPSAPPLLPSGKTSPPCGRGGTVRWPRVVRSAHAGSQVACIWTPLLTTKPWESSLTS